MILSELPHFLLFAEASTKWIDDEEIGTWRFQLQALAGDDHFSAAGSERMAGRDRLEVLAVVRGLEALDQPSQITLLSSSRYVRRGFRQGLDQWQRTEWRWERFGRRVPVKNADLWQRVAHALKFHRVDCRLWRIDAAPMESASRAPIPRPHFRRRIVPSEEGLQFAAG